MAVGQETKDNSCCWAHREQETLVQSWWEHKVAWPLWEMIHRFLKQFEIQPLYDLQTPLLGIYTKELNPAFWKDIRPSCALEQYMSVCLEVDSWLKNMWCDTWQNTKSWGGMTSCYLWWRAWRTLCKWNRTGTKWQNSHDFLRYGPGAIALIWVYRW